MSKEEKKEAPAAVVTGEIVSAERGPVLSLRENTFEALHRQARALAPSLLIPKSLRGATPQETQANILLVLAYGAELGLGAVASLAGIAVVNGRPFSESNTLAAVVRSSSKCLYLRCTESTPKAVTWETHRDGEPGPDRRTFTWEMAITALYTGKDTYKQHPIRMLSARALGWLLRDVYPELVKGMSTEAERDDAETPAPAPLRGVAGTKAAVQARLNTPVPKEELEFPMPERVPVSSEPDAAERAAILAQEMALEPGASG
jgi:hypothetical protein